LRVFRAWREERSGTSRSGGGSTWDDIQVRSAVAKSSWWERRTDSRFHHSCVHWPRYWWLQGWWLRGCGLTSQTSSNCGDSGVGKSCRVLGCYGIHILSPFRAGESSFLPHIPTDYNTCIQRCYVSFFILAQNQ
jgi:hypothetical protein